MNVSGPQQAAKAWFIEAQIKNCVNYSTAVKEYDASYDSRSS